MNILFSSALLICKRTYKVHRRPTGINKSRKSFSKRKSLELFVMKKRLLRGVKVQEILSNTKKVGRDQSLTVSSNTRTKANQARSGFKSSKRSQFFMQVSSTPVELLAIVAVKKHIWE